MNFERYSRQTQLKEFGLDAQKKLLKAKVLVVGAGGLGVPVLTYLNAMGIGTLGVIDDDVVSITNLHRQVAYDESEIGKPKVSSFIKKLQLQNSETILIPYHSFLTVENALEIINTYDVVVDASDNFATRYLVNDACVILNKPFVYGALHSFDGQVSVFNFENGPTYRCLFPTMPNANEVPNCDENGVLGVIPGIIGNLQALEAVKVITGIGSTLSGKLLLFDGLNQNYQKINFSKVVENGEIKNLRKSYDFSCDISISSIEAIDLEVLISHEKIQLLDVRTNEEYTKFHLKNTIHIPISELENRTSELNFLEDLYVVCQSGIRSQKAITFLKEKQPNTNFINVTGGINKMNVYAAK
ncbi:ThiF family adenylyltransferase [Cellulophaga sp. HaHaR_3_176]|uniref:HesA/MoeB/ThiF family protein n=1 Tax=Cellulophaga sp. HaHaR_3_176 TaxID=1942464 RepID=UPI001C1FE539|nr:HesA/MoeB/ThiF family protein [Cellulophaga sp. HaHaR_3_176]QWX82497.1 ThiF family adenylyltransferase [Cellulophaga sp. HaHaR_3_176]